jgi:hypothetical protein
MFRPLLFHHQSARQLYKTVALYIVHLSVEDRYSEQLQHDQLFDTAVYSSEWGTGGTAYRPDCCRFIGNFH